MRRSAVAISLIFVLLLTGCSFHFTKPTVTTTQVYAAGVALMAALKYKQPEWATLVKEFVEEQVIPALKTKNCAGIEMKDWFLAGLDKIAVQVKMEDKWRQLARAAIQLLDDTFQPSVECTEKGLEMLKAFANGLLAGYTIDVTNNAI